MAIDLFDLVMCLKFKFKIILAFCFAVAALPHLSASYGQSPNPISMRIDKEGRVKIEKVSEKGSVFPEGAIVFFAGDSRESYSVVKGEWNYENSTSPVAEFSPDTSSRGTGNTYFSGKTKWSTLDLRLRNSTTTKGASSLLVPSRKATLVDGKLEFYRESDEGEQLDDLLLSISKGKDEIARFKIPAGENYLYWDDIEGLSEELRGGLAPGVYWIQYYSNDGNTRYPIRVSEEHLKSQIFDRAKSVSAILGDEHPLSVQLLVEEMLLRDTPLLSDAFAVLQNFSSGKKNISPRLNRMRAHIVKRLRDPSAEHDYSNSLTVSSSGTSEGRLNEIADLIDRGHWSKAIKTCQGILDEPSTGADQLALATMYRGVAFGHSGAIAKDDAISDFESAIEQASDLDSTDAKFRCHSNFGNFFLDASFDGLHRVDFNSATTRYPLLLALTDLALAEQQFVLAEKHAKSQTQKQSIMFDFARHWFLLAEFGRIANANEPKELVTQFIAKCETQAKEALAPILKSKSSVDSQVVPAAHELMANVHFRRNQFDTALEHVNFALSRYTDLGFLPGFESSTRLRALVYEAMGKFNESLEDLEVASKLSLILQSRFSDESFGRYRSGFLSRRILASSRRVELLVEQKKPVEALMCVEEQKAIALRSLLSSSGNLSQDFDVSTALENWPGDSVLLQYYLGPKNSFVFLIDGKGEVNVEQIKKPDGTEISTNELLGKVQASWTNIASFKRRHLESAVSTSTPVFENKWQDELHELFNLLVPKNYSEQVLSAKHLTFVPHHSLHFFPFAALVAEKDSSATSERLARPEYLLDRVSSISYSPSLRYFIGTSDIEPTVNEISVLADDRPESNLAAVSWEIESAQENMVGASVFLASSGDLTVSNARKQLTSKKMVFFGCHGENETEDPLLSRLDLGDRDLLCKEIFETEIKSPFVFLSACETALAESSPMASDDLFGLERSLLAKGCQTVVSGMWLVDDRRGGRVSSEFLRLFSSGRHDAARCLVDAQRECISLYQNQDPSEPRFSVFTHPHFWAVFRVCGNHLTKWKEKK